MRSAKLAAKESPAATPKKAATPAPTGSSRIEHVAFQLVGASATPSREEAEADAEADAAVSGANPYGVVIEDGLPPGEGQVNRTAFMEALAPLIESTADSLLKPAGRVAKDCPYLAFWVSR